MKKIFILAGLMTYFSIPLLANSAGISVSIGQPGFYGQINLGNHYPNPQLVYPNPVTVTPSAIGSPPQPIYLHVPPGHAKKWSKHCYRYNACSQPTYFVQEKWYNDVYRTQYHNQSSYSDEHAVKNHHHPQQPNNSRSKHTDPKHFAGSNHNQRGKHEQKNHDAKKYEKDHSINR